MSSASFVINLTERTRGGALSTSSVQKIKQCLLNNGFILLPSDTCYAVATLARDRSAQDRINTLLDRRMEPISLSFPDFERVEQWVTMTPVAAALLERFSPGPITVVCRASAKVPEAFTSEVIRSEARTIGVRIPDSEAERQVAASTKYLTTTVAVRNPRTREVIRDFQQALALVGKGADKIGDYGWGAVEGDEFYAGHSTVVLVSERDNGVKLLREGAIPFPEVLAASRMMPLWAIEDWT